MFRNKKRLISIFAILFGIILLAVTAPIYRLAFYATPYYDDFNYAISVKMIWEQSHSFIEVLKEAAWVVKTTYYSWQGTYSSIFLMSLMPAVWGTKYYFIGIFAIITMLVVAVMFFTYVITRCVFYADRLLAFLLSEIVTIGIVTLFYSAQQGIYWYNGAIHYTFMHGLMLFTIALELQLTYNLIKQTKKQSILLLLLISLLSAVIAGANFITALQGLLISALIYLRTLYVHKKKALFLLIPIAIYVAGIVISIAAPGNEQRQARYDGYARGALDSIRMSFVSAFQYFGKFTGIVTLAFALILVPFIYILVKNSKLSYRFPGLVSVLSFCLYATGFTPSWYGMGEAGLARTFCAVKITFQLLLVLNEIYWIGWISKKMKKDVSIIVPVCIVLCGILLIPISFTTSKDKAGSFVCYGAYYYVHTGEAYNYYNEQLTREENIIKSDADVELDPLVWRPWFLCKKNELSEDAYAEQNVAMARWYGKSSIRVKSSEAE